MVKKMCEMDLFGDLHWECKEGFYLESLEKDYKQYYYVI